jgi:hypothetical protein
VVLFFALEERVLFLRLSSIAKMEQLLCCLFPDLKHDAQSPPIPYLLLFFAFATPIGVSLMLHMLMCYGLLVYLQPSTT